jgi:hypothetical protein
MRAQREGDPQVAYRYSLPIRMDLGPDGTPTHFTWRGERYTLL